MATTGILADELDFSDLSTIDASGSFTGGVIPLTIGSITAAKISTSSIATGISALEEAEPTEMDPNNVLLWSTKALDNLFGTKWGESQLYGVLADLDMLDSPDGFVAGGSMVRHFMKTEIFKGDIDIFPKDEASLKRLVNKYQDIGNRLEKHKYSYSFEYKKGVKKTKVQIIHRNPVHLSKTLSEFDFEHVRIAYQQGRFKATMGAPVALAQRQLHLRYVKEPNYTLLRALKYKGLGFSADKAIHQLAVMINHNEKNVNAADWEEKNPIVEY